MAVQQGGEFNALPGLPPATAPSDLDNVARACARPGPPGRRCGRWA